MVRLFFSPFFFTMEVFIYLTKIGGAKKSDLEVSIDTSILKFPQHLHFTK